MRSTVEVLDHHPKCFAQRDLDAVMADHVGDAVFSGPDGALRGPNGISPVFERMFAESPNQVRLSPESSESSKGITHIWCGPRKKPAIRTSWQALLLSFRRESFECKLSQGRSNRSIDAINWPCEGDASGFSGKYVRG